MCKVQMLRALVNERLTAAVEEIFVVLERTIAEYEQELSQTKDDNERQRQLLDAVFKPQVVLHREEDVSEDLLPKHQEWSSKAGQEEPQPPHIKDEEEEQVWTQEDADIRRFPLTCVIVKSEGDNDEAERSQVDGSPSEETRRPAAADSLLAPLSDSDNTTSRSPDTDHEGSKDDMTCHTDSTHFKCSQCDKTFDSKSHLKKHTKRHSDGKQVKCSQCDKTFVNKSTLKTHLRCHTGEKPFSCSFCGKKFSQNGNLLKHTRTHTGEKPFSCSSCNKRFSIRANMITHTRTHTGEKPFACSVCGLRVAQKIHLTIHMRRHTGEKPFSCSLCDKTFCDGSSLGQHTKTHTGEKLFSCKRCSKRFTRKFQVHHHKCAGGKAAASAAAGLEIK